MKVSVICATYNRATLLDNALASYAAQTMPREDWEYLICDDMSDDATHEVVTKWQEKGLPLRYFTAEELGYPKVPGQWRDGCTLRNAVSTHAFGEVLVATHPEIILTPAALQSMYEASVAWPDSWITAIPYWMPNTKMPSGWKKDVAKLQKMDGFYDPSWPDPIHSPGAPDYRNQNQEIRTTWESEVFWAMTMKKWRWMGGFRNFEVWGSVDMDFLNRRNRLSISTVLCPSLDAPAQDMHHEHTLMVFHQWHESKRDMDAAMKALQGATYNTPEAARSAGGLYPIYHHGHRERATDGHYGGILEDHKKRYQWAAIYVFDKSVLDIPCGTGYGTGLLSLTARHVFGMDIDAESIEWADQHYRGPNVTLRTSPMQEIDLPDRCVDMVVSFEGLEHIDWASQRRFVDEMYRVLVPGGTIIISTPQKGAAAGTPWDRYILDAQGLLNLFGDGRWKDIDLFYQRSYGSSEEIQFANRWQEPDFDCQIPTSAQIMILGATKA